MPRIWSMNLIEVRGKPWHKINNIQLKKRRCSTLWQSVMHLERGGRVPTFKTKITKRDTIDCNVAQRPYSLIPHIVFWRGQQFHQQRNSTTIHHLLCVIRFSTCNVCDNPISFKLKTRLIFFGQEIDDGGQTTTANTSAIGILLLASRDLITDTNAIWAFTSPELMVSETMDKQDSTCFCDSLTFF